MLSFVVPRSRCKIVLWLVFLLVIVAFRLAGDALLPSGSDASTQLQCTSTPTSQVGALQSCELG